MSLAHDLHAAHKARLARIAGAAFMSVPHVKLPVENAPPSVLRRRREYETAKHPSAYLPLSARILRAVAAEFDLTVPDMISGMREHVFVTARFVCVGIMVEMTNMSLPAMGRRLGGRDHTTMIHARAKAQEMFAEEAFRNRIDQIKADILA